MPDQDSIIRKIEALMRKAESTEFDEEREALLAKADEFILRYQIEHAQLFLNEDIRVRKEEVEMQDIYTDNPWEPFKGLLLHYIAQHYNCKTVKYPRYSGRRLRKIVGFPSDIEIVKVMWNSLCTQALVMAARDMRTMKPKLEHGKTWKVNYLDSFAIGINRRLTEMRNMNKKEMGLDDFLPVLAKREEEVEEKYEELFPNLSKGTAITRQFSSSGMSAGYNASKRADIGSKGVGQRGQIGM